MTKNGLSADRAKDFVGSFEGDITARIVRSGEDFNRYTDSASSKGSFLTKSSFSSPEQAVKELYLGPYGNGASLQQSVTATKRSIVLEGGVKNGGTGTRQTLITQRDAFSFGEGKKYGN